ncbi:ABC transporter substrate-binding protein [Ilumatobacter sp.]|uniref:ABC transporter substrate-binding protein n=1 Tax=Ilumatobacter sp. TaxID=1967498 RepID=UPI003B52EF5D
MTMETTRRSIQAATCAVVLSVMAACGSDSDSSSSDAVPDTAITTESAAATDPGPPDADPGTAEGGTAETTEAPGESTAPSEMSGDPFLIGVQNLEGDPAGSFPEFTVAIDAATEYINAELGGLGGRPIELVECNSFVSPDDSQRCANELSAADVDLAISTINFFGNHLSIFEGSGIPVVVLRPITVADFTSPGVYSIGAGGGCLGSHTGLVQFVTGEIEDLEDIDVQRVAVPWADTPPGVFCYNDLEAKPLDVIAGTTPGESARAGEKSDLEHIGVPIVPASPDVTPQVTEILDFEPDAIMFSAQGADCWNLVDGLGRLGWTPDQTPLALSGACTDFAAMDAAGDLAVGIYFTGTTNSLLSSPDGIDGQHLEEVTTYREKGAEYGMSDDDLFKGFAAQGFSGMMNIWEIANTIEGDITGQAISDAFAATDGSSSAFGGSPLD